MANIENGYGVIAGRGRDNARKALAAAEAAGLPATAVRTVAEGYLVPEAVLKAFEQAAEAEAKIAEAESKPEPKKAAPKKATKKSAPKSADKSEEAPAESETDKKGE